MKRTVQAIFILSLALFLNFNTVFGQKLQFAQIESNVAGDFNNVPRLSWSIPITTTIYDQDRDFKKPLRYKNFYATTGIVLRNQGVIYDNNELNIRKKHRALGIGPTISLFQEFNKNLTITVFAGFDYFFHYKEKTFAEKKRSNKEKFSEWNSNRINKLNGYVGAGFTISENVLIYGEYYLNSFFNADFSETIDGPLNIPVKVQPYKDFNVTKFSIGVTWDFNSNRRSRQRQKRIIIIDTEGDRRNSNDEIEYISQ